MGKYLRVIVMKRFLAGVAAILLVATPAFSCSAISAESAILWDVQTEQVLYEKSPDKRHLIASTTKIMTALVVAEQCNVLDRVRITKEAVGIEGSSMYLREGEVLTVQELLYGLMLQSGNDAAVALAIYCAGTVEGFVELMNDKACRLGLTNTHFGNPHGLDNPDNYSTARDLAKLAAYAMENPIFSKTVSTKTISISNRSLRNHNKLLWMVEGADGVKTGYTKAAGRILVSSCLRNGRRLIAVTINDGNDWSDHQKLYEEAYTGYTVYQVVRKGDIIEEIPVISGNVNKVSLLAGSDFCYALQKNEHLKIVVPYPQFVYAPVAEGQEAGYAYISLHDKIVGKIPLVCGVTVNTDNGYQMSQLEKFFNKVKK